MTLAGVKMLALVGMFAACVLLSGVENTHAQLNNLISSWTQKHAGELDKLSKLANDGSADAAYKLGDLYSTGGDFYAGHNYDLAAYWYRQAALQGHAEASFRLGFLYISGRGVNKNTDEAIIWFQKAASKGNESAKYAVENLQSLTHNNEDSEIKYRIVKLDDSQVCIAATLKDLHGVRSWDSGTKFINYVFEAKERKLSPEICAAILDKN